jgi:Na+/H+-dicarboxylate symporter
MQVAFVESSSFASLPVSLRCVTHNLGVNKRLRRVRGAARCQHQDGRLRRDLSRAHLDVRGAVFQSRTGASQYFVILLASVLGSFGTAGVPGTAMVMATVVLSAAGLPLEGIGFLVAIDRVLDMMRTMTNVTGQMLVPVLVAKEAGLLDQAVYDAGGSEVGIAPGFADASRETS